MSQYAACFYIKKSQRGNNYDDSATHKFTPSLSPEVRAANMCKIPCSNCEYFQTESLGLQPEGGDTDKVTFHVEKSDEAEVGIKTLALKKKFLDILANPKGGN